MAEAARQRVANLDKTALLKTMEKLIGVLRLTTECGTELGPIHGISGAVSDVALEDMARLIDLWADQTEDNLTALVGMVNAGKSAIGNILLKHGESGAFQEGITRETSTPDVKQSDPDTRLVDLPGLGSVLAATDDAVVRKYVRRASLILLVIGVDTNITEHLYRFLTEEIEPSQRVVIVLNKIDILDQFPEAYRRKSLEVYTKYLVDGDRKTGFPGIRQLFAYDVPIIPFSVQHIRTGVSQEHEYRLREAIKEALRESATTLPARLRGELLRVCDHFEPLDVALAQSSKKVESTTASLKFLFERIVDLVNTEQGRLGTTIVRMDRACWEEMQRLPKPSDWAKFFETSAFTDAKGALREIRERWATKMQVEVDSYINSITRDVNNLAATVVPSIERFSAPAAGVSGAVQAIAWINWDVHDDVYFLGKPVSSSRTNERTAEKIEALSDILVAHFESLKSKLIELLDSFETAGYWPEFQRQPKLSSLCSAFNEVRRELAS